MLSQDRLELFSLFILLGFFLRLGYIYKQIGSQRPQRVVWPPLLFTSRYLLNAYLNENVPSLQIDFILLGLVTEHHKQNNNRDSFCFLLIIILLEFEEAERR